MLLTLSIILNFPSPSENSSHPSILHTVSRSLQTPHRLYAQSKQTLLPSSIFISTPSFLHLLHTPKLTRSAHMRSQTRQQRASLRMFVRFVFELDVLLVWAEEVWAMRWGGLGLRRDEIRR
jgi:hypothetical protein